MDNVQKEMLSNLPQREAPSKKLITKKRAAIVLGIATGGVAAYLLGPTILGKVQAYRVAKAIKAGIGG